MTKWWTSFEVFPNLSSNPSSPDPSPLQSWGWTFCPRSALFMVSSVISFCPWPNLEVLYHQDCLCGSQAFKASVPSKKQIYNPSPDHPGRKPLFHVSPGRKEFSFFSIPHHKWGFDPAWTWAPIFSFPPGSELLKDKAQPLSWVWVPFQSSSCHPVSAGEIGLESNSGHILL